MSNKGCFSRKNVASVWQQENIVIHHGMGDVMLTQANAGYRGRVRTGCITCRSRKVRCDEARPVCNNCRRLQRECVYKSRKTRRPIAEVLSPDDQPTTTALSSPSKVTIQSPVFHGLSPPDSVSSLPLDRPQNPEETTQVSLSDSPKNSTSPYPHIFPADVPTRLENALPVRNSAAVSPDGNQVDGHSPSTYISRDILLTTTMDRLNANSRRSHFLSSFFITSMECPGVTPYDNLNWQRMKHHIVDLGDSCPAISLGVNALSALLKANMYALTRSGALLFYESAKSALQELLEDRGQDFDLTLVSAFLLCLFEFILSGDLVPVLKEPSEQFMARLGEWAQAPSNHSDLSMRLVTWLKILYKTSLRGGGMGLISDAACALFPAYNYPLPNIKIHPDHQSDVSTHLFEVISTPLFDFYFRLQMISGEIAQLTHYHRSRTTGVDQEEVSEEIRRIKSRLHDLWDSRSGIQRHTPEELRAQLAPVIAQKVISLVGLCAAAYHAEIVEIDRVLGDPVNRWTDSRPSMQAIRDLVEHEWAQLEEDGSEKLDPGYLRPLFLYAIEAMDEDQNAWAVERIAGIGSPLYRSDFFSAFGKALSDAQLEKQRRVTSKFFCISYFGAPPPFM